MQWDKVEVKTEQVIDENPQTWVAAAEEDYGTGNFDSALAKLQQAHEFAKGKSVLPINAYTLEISIHYEQNNAFAARKAASSAEEDLGKEAFQRYTNNHAQFVLSCLRHDADYWRKTWIETIRSRIAELDYELLEKYLSDENVPEFTDKTLVEYATNDFVFAVVRDSKLKLLEVLHRSGFNLNAWKNSSGQNLTMLATNSSSDILEFLLNNRINDVNEKNASGETALLYLANSSSYFTKNFELLINAGADVNAANKNGRTISMILAECNNDSVLSLLIDSGANIFLKDAKGCDALYYANFDCIKVLIEHGANINNRYEILNGGTLLHKAAQQWLNVYYRYWEVVLDLSEDVNVTDNCGCTPLEYALDHSWVLTAELDLPRALVKKGAVVTSRVRDICRRRGIKVENLYNNSTNFFFSTWF